MRIAVLANLRESAPSTEGLPSDVWDDLDSPATIHAVVQVLEGAGHHAAFLEGDLRLVTELPRFRPDLCFNLCEGHQGDSRESHVPALLEMLRLPYTGAGVRALAVTHDKPTTKRVLASQGLPTPAFQVFESPHVEVAPHLRFPLFVKPAREGSSIGVSADSIVRDAAALRRRVAWVLATYRQPALVEQWIEGREITVGVLGNPGAEPPVGTAGRLPRVGGLSMLPPYEILLEAFPDSGGVYTQAIKSEARLQIVAGRHYQCPPALPPARAQQIYEIAAAVFRLTECRDVARVDFRLDAADADRPYVLEVNALPGLSPGWSDLSLQADTAGLSHADLVLAIMDHAVRRLGLGAPP